VLAGDPAALGSHAHEHRAAAGGELDEHRHHSGAQAVGADREDPVDLALEIDSVDPIAGVEGHVHDRQHAGEGP